MHNEEQIMEIGPRWAENNEGETSLGNRGGGWRRVRAFQILSNGPSPYFEVESTV